MKLKSLLFVVFFILCGPAMAAHEHVNPKANGSEKTMQSKRMAYPGHCEIEIINDSYSNVSVYGTFDDGSAINFSIFRYEDLHYISLHYYSFCHRGMYLTIQDRYGVVYAGWTSVDSIVHIVPNLMRGVNVEVL